MATVSQRGMSVLTLVALAGGLLLAQGCGRKAPDEANAALDAALKKAADEDAAGFIAAIVPDQREAAPTVPELAYFLSVKSHRIDNEFDTDVTDISARILTMLYFDEEEKTFNGVAFVMKQIDGTWLIDLAETIKLEKEVDGSDAFEKLLTFESPG